MSTHALYGGRVELRFDRQKHVYTVDDEVVPNVTTITGVIAKQGLDGWKFKQALEHLEGRLRPGLDEVALRRLLDEAASAADRVTREAGYIGSSIHKWIEEWIGESIKCDLGDYESRQQCGYPSLLLPTHPSVLAAVKAFIAWEDEAKPTYLASERKVLSVAHRYVGTMDALAVIDGKRTVVDFKSSNRVYQEHYAQLGAYSLAVEEEDGEAVDAGLVLHLPKVAGKKAREYRCADLKADQAFFLDVRRVYKRIFNK